MKDVRITVIRKASYEDLIQRYENPLDNPCEMKEGQIFYSKNGMKPDGLCDIAWETMEPFVKDLAQGKGNFFDGWMKNPYSAMVSCNDGFRPVSFYLELGEEKKEL